MALALVFWIWAGGTTQAQTSAADALRAGDVAKAVELAEAKLLRGGLKPDSWTGLQFTLGIASARTNDVDKARRAFICALALDPALRLGGGEAVEVRSPFMEARGFWSQHAQRLGASATLSDDGTTLVVSLVDPAALVARVLVGTRSVGQSRFVESSLPTAASMLASLEALPREAGVEYTLALIDENANRLWQLGSEAAPLRVGAPSTDRHAQPQVQSAPRPNTPEAVEAPGSAREQDNKDAHAARPYYVGAALSLLVAGGAAVVAGIQHAERERLARRWNRGDCDGEGTTRGEVCGHEHAQLIRRQRVATGFYALSGAGLVAGIVTLILAPARGRRSDRTSAHAFGCGAGPGAWGVACDARF